jgi:AraC-like DNA-binding protein/mannose-6-phosphate isomerase-like protein (cupin superfamily)
MYRISYHLFEDNNTGYYKNNRASDKRALIINCTGYFATESSFTTNIQSGRDDYYLIEIFEGKLDVSIDGKTRTLEVGDIVIFPPKTPYFYFHPKGEAIGYAWVHFTGAEVEKTIKEYGISKYPDVISITDDGSVQSCYRAIYDAAAKRDEFSDAELSLLLNKLLLTIGRRLNAKGTNPLKKSLAYINSSYDTEISIPHLAKLENLSVSRYNALFKQEIGIAPMKYVINIRLGVACELLRNTDLPIKEIGMHVGYDDAHFFSRLFRNHIGVSPLEYREKPER